ncbi:cache domain-containing protein [Zavarzinella formosa]|uniref:cache domain-containing protein n=1 Tax=Zavarzinella formosa TaxID=360055 RepID=UPI0002F9F05E|nr:cache domain-containing protein [Zavarzinella formosa]
MSSAIVPASNKTITLAGNGETPATDSKFSIFSPVVTVEHREFYERIVSELNGVFPICTQGKCTAVEVSEDATEQEQITDLMKRVESFSGELLEVTKQLFDQFYQAKEHFCKMIHGTTAYVKINLMDRNLLERTCDVRWWALETAFSDVIEFRERVSERLRAILDGPHNKPDGDVLREVIEEKERWEVNAAANERLQKSLAMFDDTETLIADVRAVLKKASFACDRLEDINSSYTLYRDLVIACRDGMIIANSNKTTRPRVLGLNVAGENWFQKALTTKDGTQYHAQDLTESSIETERSLIYSAGIREQSDNYGKVIGAMGVFFDFQGEAMMILEDHMSRDADNFVEDGWYSFITNSEGVVIASSDPGVIEPGKSAHLPRKQRTPPAGLRPMTYSVIEGQESAVFSARTDGYLDYPGLGWASHLVVPKDQIFRTAASNTQLGISIDELMQSRLVPDINKQTFTKVQDDKESIQLISLNGIVFASKLGKRGVALGPIFDQIKQTGEFTTSKMEYLLTEMAVGELQLNLQALENFSKQAIDLIDRNLFERAADVRWWSTDQYFWTALKDPTPENFQKAAHRMEVINGSYTMYRNLVLANRNGEVVASARSEDRHKLKAVSVYDDQWFLMAMRTNKSSEYAVQDVMTSKLEPRKERSLIYSGGVRVGGARAGDPIGVVGILFDWDTEGKKILATCLPKDRDGRLIGGCAAFYTNSHHEVIETTDPEHFPVGKLLSLPMAHNQLKAGQSTSGLLVINGQRYIMGSSRTKGYREYAGLGWLAHVLRPV